MTGANREPNGNAPIAAASAVVGLIWAQSPDGVIGKNGDLPWHLPEDLAHFKRVTMGHPVIMGRRSWDSLPERWRPLPGRSNIVLTRDHTWRGDGATVAHSMEGALKAAARADGADEIWIIGGEKVFADAVAFADLAIVTQVDVRVEAGDAFAPPLGSEWVREALEPDQGWALSESGIRYTISRYRKRIQ